MAVVGGEAFGMCLHLCILCVQCIGRELTKKVIRRKMAQINLKQTTLSVISNEG